MWEVSQFQRLSGETSLQDLDSLSTPPAVMAVGEHTRLKKLPAARARSGIAAEGPRPSVARRPHRSNALQAKRGALRAYARTQRRQRSRSGGGLQGERPCECRGGCDWRHRRRRRGRRAHEPYMNPLSLGTS